MSERENLDRDQNLIEKMAAEIEETIEALHRARNQNRLDEVEALSSSLQDQCSAYRDLRELDV